MRSTRDEARARKRDAVAAAWVLSSVTVLVLVIGVLVIRSTGPVPRQRLRVEAASVTTPAAKPSRRSAEQAILAEPAPYAPQPAAAPEPATAHRPPPFELRRN
ncbi:hypothetical protein [Botrimarina sp.]|uniref:hypothetical protein n=1 Tax=Botrimarina sp. TaxID=2795802 RepID=UPI0032ED60BE